MSNGHDHGYEAGVDREISLKGIVWTGVVLTAIVVASGFLMWWMSKGLRTSLEGADPPPPVLLEAQTQEPPPEPRLQTSPEEDMALMRAEESEALDEYRWVDEAAGVARVPIQRAMEMLANGEVPAAGAGAEAAAETDSGSDDESQQAGEDAAQ